MSECAADDENARLTQSVRNAITGAAPERLVDLDQLWQKYAPLMAIKHDRPGFDVSAASFGALITVRTIEQVWLLAFAAWSALGAYGGIIALLARRGEAFDPRVIAGLEGQQEVDKKFDERVRAAQELSLAPSREEFPWPPSVSLPGSFGTLEEQAVRDLAVVAIAYIFLHEIQHIMFAQDDNAPASAHAEELACDRFARTFLLDQVDQFAASHEVAEDGVRNKRAMGIAVGAFVVLMLTSPHDWQGTSTHPSLKERLEGLIAAVKLPTDAHLWNFCSCYVLAALRIQGRHPGAIAFTDPKDLFDKLLSELPVRSSQQ